MWTTWTVFQNYFLSFTKNSWPKQSVKTLVHRPNYRPKPCPPVLRIIILVTSSDIQKLRCAAGKVILQAKKGFSGTLRPQLPADSHWELHTAADGTGESGLDVCNWKKCFASNPLSLQKCQRNGYRYEPCLPLWRYTPSINWLAPAKVQMLLLNHLKSLRHQVTDRYVFLLTYSKSVCERWGDMDHYLPWPSVMLTFLTLN